MKKFDVIAIVFLIIAGINWGLWGVFDFNVIDYIFGKAWIDRVLYFVMGVCAIYCAILFKTIFSRMRKN